VKHSGSVLRFNSGLLKSTGLYLLEVGTTTVNEKHSNIRGRSGGSTCQPYFPSRPHLDKAVHIRQTHFVEGRGRKGLVSSSALLNCLLVTDRRTVEAREKEEERGEKGREGRKGGERKGMFQSHKRTIAARGKKGRESKKGESGRDLIEDPVYDN